MPSTPRKGANGLPSPAKSLERSQSAEEQKPKIKPPALNNITSEATSTMSPPPAKKLALSAKKVTVSSRIVQSYWPLLCVTVFLQRTCLINHVSILSPFPLICPFFLTISNSSLPYLCLFVSPSPSFHATPFYIFLIFWSHSWLFSLDHQVFIYVDNCRLAVGVRAALMLRPLCRASRPVTQYIKITLTLSPLSPPLTLTGMDFCI